MIFRSSPDRPRPELAYFVERCDDQPYSVFAVDLADAEAFAGLFPEASRVSRRRAVELGFTAPRRAAKSYDYFPGSFLGSEGDALDWRLDDVLDDAYRQSTAHLKQAQWERFRRDREAERAAELAAAPPEPEGEVLTRARKRLLRRITATIAGDAQPGRSIQLGLKATLDFRVEVGAEFLARQVDAHGKPWIRGSRWTLWRVLEVTPEGVHRVEAIDEPSDLDGPTTPPGLNPAPAGWLFDPTDLDRATGLAPDSVAELGPCYVLVSARGRRLVRVVGERWRTLEDGSEREYPGRLTSNDAKAFVFVDGETAWAWIDRHRHLGSATISPVGARPRDLLAIPPDPDLWEGRPLRLPPELCAEIRAAWRDDP